jgi:hypothetical protein
MRVYGGQRLGTGKALKGAVFGRFTLYHTRNHALTGCKPFHP